MMRGKVLLAAAMVLAASPAFSVIVTLQQGVDGYAGTQDAHIISWDGNQNQLVRTATGGNGGNGSATATTGGNPQNAGGHIFIEEGDFGSTFPLFDDSKCIVIQFNTSQLSGTVTSAQIALYYWYERSTGNANTELSGTKLNPHTLNVTRILKPWAEGNGGATSGVDGDDAPDNSGVVTWNSTGFELWQAIGAEGPEDIAPTESSIEFDPFNGGWTFFDVTASVKHWLANPGENHGVKISQEVYPISFKTPDLTLPNGMAVYKGHPADPSPFEPGAHNFISSENNNSPDLRPQLIIDGTISIGTSVMDWQLME